jgi:IclR family acetate operon transcriptional repressor
MTSLTLTSRKALLEDLAEVRRVGYSVNRGERIPGVCGVAAPVLDTQAQPVAAVAVQGPAVRVTEARYAALGRTIRDVAAEVSAALPDGYRL